MFIGIKMLFVTLLCPKGKGSDAIKYLKELKAPEGVKIREVFFTWKVRRNTDFWSSRREDSHEIRHGNWFCHTLHGWNIGSCSSKRVI